MDNDHPDEPESYIAGQTKRGTRYFEVDLQGQRSWYSARASACKRRADGFALIVITAGSLTTFVAALGDGAWIKPVTAALGTTVAVAEGWMGYRIASERMKREFRLYVNGAGGYRRADDEEEVYSSLIPSF
jgi:hypothetical protein